MPDPRKKRGGASEIVSGNLGLETGVGRLVAEISNGGIDGKPLEVGLCTLGSIVS